MKKLFTILFIAVISANAFAQHPCQAYFTYSFNPTGGTYVNLYDASYNLDSTQISVTSWTWTATYGGAVHTYTGQNPVIQLNGYTGNIPVCLTITTTYLLQTCQSTWCDTIILNTTPTICTADFSYNVDSLNHLYNFYDQSTTNNGSVNSWNWVIRNGSTGAIVYSSNNYQNPVVNLPQNFVYGVCLTITTDSGCTATYCDSVIVGNPPIPTYCVAAFSYHVDTVAHTIQFTDQSYTNNGTVNSWAWTLTQNNGLPIITSNLQNPVFTNMTNGWYYVCLNTSTDSGCVAQYCQQIYTIDTNNTFPCQLTVNPFINPVSVINGNDGFIDLTVTGGTPPYTYQWNTGATTQDIYNLSSGVYTVAISTTPACPNYTYTFYVANPLDSLNFIIDTLNTQAIDTCLGFIIDSFYVASISVQGNTVIVQWVFMGGGATTTLIATYTFTNFGNQMVILTISCNGSKDLTTFMSYIYISQSLGLTEKSEANQMNLYPNPVSDFLNITFSNQTTNSSSLKIFNTAGQQVYASSVASKTSQFGINVSDLPSGVYFVQIDTGNGKPMVKKFVK